jgi:glycosyltransferase involved in cell wall biosynthesis
MLKDRTRGAVTLEVIGPTYDDGTTELLLDAHTSGDLIWHGYLPADEALSRVRGALAGLSLLSDTPNFRNSMPTKVLEYCAYGVPVITTPLPLAARLVERSGSGLVVPWDDPGSVVETVVQLRVNGAAQAMGQRGHQLAATEYNWARWSKVFAEELESVAAGPGR